MTNIDELIEQLAATIPRPAVDVRERAADRLRTEIEAEQESVRAVDVAPPRRRRSSRRWVIIAAIVATAALAAGSAQALGLFDSEAHQAFNAGGGCPKGHMSTPQRAVTTALPNGHALELWTAVVRTNGRVDGFCTSLIGDHGKNLFPEKPYIPSAGWTGAAGIEVKHDRPTKTNGFNTGGGDFWADYSPGTRVDCTRVSCVASGGIYSVHWGIAGDATTVEFHLANGHVQTATISDGWYMILTPLRDLSPRYMIIARDKSNKVLFEANQVCENDAHHFDLIC